MSDKKDLLIVGGGLVGMALALAAARKGFSSHVVDRADPADLLAEDFDGRASAISTASWNLFRNIGIADDLEPHACPIASIAVTDQMKPGWIDFTPGPHEGSLGRMFANRQLRLSLFEAARKEPLIVWHAPVDVIARERGEFEVSVTLGDGTRLRAALMVGAEGRRSPTREDAGLMMATWDYSHRAIIVGLDHTKPHDNVAWEIFYPAGPFALLPMLDGPDGQHRSALVWTVDEKDAAGVLAMSDRAFLAEVDKRMGDLLGEVSLNSRRSSYPLSFQHTARMTGERLVLVGDSAHGMHPIAGQGLNLGLRDVGALVEVLDEARRLGLDLGDAQMLKRYEDWRALDSLMVMGATDGLTRLFGVPGKIASAIRRLGMAGVQRSGLLKQFFMDEARGMSGDLPDMLRA
ncbi:UbiH/UbiF/VisC/COQ6 family ubiquinone biosynthesis hydroxylase [Altererythrobacter arenosus]|uniref:UbiH/UbiF/VisC/COQ6 family ubiquinone biosynthesis hydroxylase n=1 Tax=Altererythrobacter arenosus TaxID=3032592 RepID=A0ABY8FWN4_9SPHN|nr:UbiH/UbiF/VisC/COQ6 family ubiquinone biosynthesis hydroxylase [Altererythrobacter sp. CAU 1644]WFL76444.1 UbiH/UbiF/VisC/COQ6 family ubiquinone biosynthesis hydroxylase [Altererythrobacter sp. CAU 1644]